MSPSTLAGLFLLGSGCTDDSPALADTDTSEMTDSSDPCQDVLELTLSASVLDQADPAEPGSAAALLADVPAGCDVVLSLTQAAAHGVGSDLALPGWTTRRFADGAWLELDHGATLTVDEGLEAGRARDLQRPGRGDGHSADRGRLARVAWSRGRR